MNKIEFLHNIDKYKGEDHSTFLQHYGILGQKWGQRRWQNPDGTFNEEGKIRYFGKKNSSNVSDEDKVSGMKSDVKDYLKFRNKMLKKRTTEELNKWYRENNKAADKQMLKDAKKVDKQRDKFYKNQLKDFYDDPNELVSDLDRIYKVGGKEGKVENIFDVISMKKFEDLPEDEKENRIKEIVKIRNDYKNDKTIDEIAKTSDYEDYQIKEIVNNLRKQLLDDARANVKPTKELKGKDISDGELQEIINDMDNVEGWQDWRKLSQSDLDKIADLGYDAMARSSKYMDTNDDMDMGLNGLRDWFIYEDQTIGLPQLAKLYYDGYSKDYINKMIDKVSSMSREEYENKYGEDSATRFFIDYTNYQNQNKEFVNALFDPDYDVKNQKIGFSPKEAKKLAKEAEKLEKELKNAKYQDEQKIINSLINDDKYKDTIDEAIKPYVEKNKKNIDRVNEIFKDYEDNEINTLANAGIVNSLINKWGDKNNNETMKELAGYAWFYLNDDGNQSDNTAEYLYATIDKGIKAKELDNLWDNLRYSNEEKKENISSLKKDPFLSNLSDDTLKKIVTNKFESKFNKSSYWNLYNASDTASDPDNTVKKAYNEAKNISKKLEKSCGNTNGWDYFWKAVDNLGMNDMNYKDLSQADWDRINAEINKLKK